MTNSDPENEVYDCEAPAYRIIQSPYADPIPKQVGNHQEQDHQQHTRDTKSPPPSQRRLFLCVVGHQLGDLVERRISLNQRIVHGKIHVARWSYIRVGRIHGRKGLSSKVESLRIEAIMSRVQG